MNHSSTKKLGLTSRADIVDLLASGPNLLGVETAWALGFEFQPLLPDHEGTINVVSSTAVAEKETVEQQPGWTQFQPAPSQYWRVTGYESLTQDIDGRKRKRKKRIAKLPNLDEIRKAFGFDIEKMLPRQPLAEINYVTTQLRKAAGTGRSRHELDLTAAVDRLGRGQFLFRMPHRVRRVWGHDLLCLEDRAYRLVPYWSDQDDVTFALSRLYPETGYTVARLQPGRTVIRIQSPEALFGQECPLPAPGTLVLALTDLGSLATGDDGDHVRDYWNRLGRLYSENGNRALAMVPCHPEQVPMELARYWHLVPWERTASAGSSGAATEGLERLLTLLSVAVRLEPELLRAVRKLLPETRDNSGVEAMVWQHPFVSSPNSVAADLSPIERKKRIADFEAEDINLRKAVLQLIRDVRQIGYEDVWASELLGLDPSSQEPFSKDVELAEQQILSLASPGSKEHLHDYAVWLERLKDQLTRMPHMKTEVREALDRLVRQVSDAKAGLLAEWMPDRVVPDPDSPERTVEIRQRGNTLLLQNIEEALTTSVASSAFGSLIGRMRTRSGEFRIHEVTETAADTGWSEATFWASGRKPAWVHSYGTDEYGAWCSFRLKDVEQILRWIPPGEFLMGSPDDEEGRFDNEGPQHWVKISRGFWMCETPCTQELWQVVMGNNPSLSKGVGRPVEYVSWVDVQTFNRNVSHYLGGVNTVLPTEAQWEYAARGRGEEQDRARYGALDEIAWYASNSNKQTHIVLQKRPNSYGLDEVLGNVREWCRDCAYRRYRRATEVDPYFEPESSRRSARRIIRGGSWDMAAKYLRAACRGGNTDSYKSGNLGFRSIVTPTHDAFPLAIAASNSWRQPREIESSVDLGVDRVTSRFQYGDIAGVFVSGGDYVSSVSSRMLQLPGDFTTARISLPATCVMQLETDCEILSMELAPPPSWAVASGRDRYGLWAEFELSGVRQRLRWIPPGQFLMGSPESEFGRYADEGPQHTVTITTGFWIFDTPCTQRLWGTVMASNSSETIGEQHPVSRVSYDDAFVFAERLGEELPGLTLSLPTEAQWEYCCRAGESKASYGNPADISWFSKNSGLSTHPVRTKLPNRWGLFDMLGNAYERCVDCHRIYEATSVVDPVGGMTGDSERVIRGGSWGSHARIIRAAYRNSDHPAGRVDRIGFRCVSSPELREEKSRELTKTTSDSPRDGKP